MSDNVWLRQIQRCDRCPLAAVRRNIVLGRGELEQRPVLLIGEGPGQAEDALGQAFVGPSGKLLDYMLESAGINPHTECYFTNVVLCRAADRKGGENREPEPAEIAACGENVMYLANLVNPCMTVLVGDIAYRYYRRTFIHRHITHPAVILRTGGKSSPMILRNINILKEVREEIWR